MHRKHFRYWIKYDFPRILTKEGFELIMKDLKSNFRLNTESVRN